MQEKVLQSLLLRAGMPVKDLLQDMIEDCEMDLKDLLHVENLTDAHASILKEMVLIRVNHDGVEGISNENHSGVSTSYLDDLPKSLLRKIRSKRKLKR